MNGDQPSNEILRVLGSIESSVNTLTKAINEHQEDLKTIRTTCQRFEDYREARKDLPDRICALEMVAEGYLKGKNAQAEKDKQVEFLMEKYRAAIIAAAIINLLAIMLGFLLTKGWLSVTI